MSDPAETVVKALVLAAAAAGLLAMCWALCWVFAARKSPTRRLAATLERLAAIAGRYDQQAWADRLRGLALDVRRQPKVAAEELLDHFQGRDSLATLVLTRGGVAFKRPGREWRETLAFCRLRAVLYAQALALWHATRTTSPLEGIDDGAALVMLVDYGGGCEVWRRGETYFVRYDVGSHISCWREDPISRREAEQAALGPEHFDRMVAALQTRLRARGADVTAGSLLPLPDPTLG